MRELRILNKIVENGKSTGIVSSVLSLFGLSRLVI